MKFRTIFSTREQFLNSHEHFWNSGSNFEKHKKKYDVNKFGKREHFLEITNFLFGEEMLINVNIFSDSPNFFEFVTKI